jgi:hypothetical protein
VRTYTRAFQLGDRVRTGDTVGDVAEKTLVVTRRGTIGNVAVTIPLPQSSRSTPRTTPSRTARSG